MQGQTGRAFCTDSHPRQGQLEDLVIPLSRRKEKSECCQPGIFNQGVTNPITLPYPRAARWGVQANNTFFPFDWFAHCESWGWEEESKRETYSSLTTISASTKLKRSVWNISKLLKNKVKERSEMKSRLSERETKRKSWENISRKYSNFPPHVFVFCNNPLKSVWCHDYVN